MADPILKLLFVDDDPLFLTVAEAAFRDRFTVASASSAAGALERLEREGPFAVMVADRSMPGMNGVELLERSRKLAPDMVRIMITGDADRQAAIDAINRGQVFYFLTKPCAADALAEAVEAAVNGYRLAAAKRRIADDGPRATVALLATVLGTVAPEALGRGQRLADSMRAFAPHLGGDSDEAMESAALLSQLGYASVPPSMLRRVATGATLAPAEEALLSRVPQFGHDLLADLPALRAVARLILYQEKHFDGTGFPEDEVKGEAIPLGARALKILKGRLDLENDGVVKRRAFDAMAARHGSYDPALLEKCFAVLPEFLVSALSKDRPVFKLRVPALKAGQILVSDATARDGSTLIQAGTRLTEAIIHGLQRQAELLQVNEPLLVQDPPK